TNSIYKLDDWIDRNGWAGYDPYDVKGHPLWLKLQQLGIYASFTQKVERRLLSILESRCPMLIRGLFRIEKQVNAKAMGLFAIAYINLYKSEKKEQYLNKAQQCIDWLIDNPSQSYSGLCWGYPFDWQSLVFIPKGTPSGVVSSVCGRAFWEFYQLTKEQQYLEICQSICQFYMNDLNIDIFDNNRVCFSYTPVDNFHVHNANLFVAESLIRVGNHINNSEFIQIGTRAMNYTITKQNEDGSFYYWGPPDKYPCHIDHYHTGFVLRALYSIYKITGDRYLFTKIEKCYYFYLKHLFEDKMIPKLTPDSKYPINIHSCSEAILCLSTLIDDFPEGLETLKKTTLWTIENMQNKRGFFYYMKFPRYIAKIPYIRWAQAWMLSALTSLLISNGGAI
ncbi:MAG: hypothetical protein QG588_1979, partial [Candidatus Poribacteria bacterium]|nr:hypothetical protein [Candidatus Poribacteria bacterium]